MTTTPPAAPADPAGAGPDGVPPDAQGASPGVEAVTDGAAGGPETPGAAADAAQAGGLLDKVVRPTPAQTEAMSRVVGPVFVVCAVLLVPWTAYLYVSLPSRQVSHHYDLAWAGFDVGLAVTLLATAAALVRLSRVLPMAASSLATMLLVDAWFDVVTAPARERALSVGMALLVELPLAAVALWIAYHGQQLRERAVVLRFLRTVPRDRLPRLWRRAQRG